jgi:ABC-type polysaccharide/polyol phosphate transport system ATPase subunit
VKSGASQTTAAQILSDSLRVTFGNANANGFMMWVFRLKMAGKPLCAGGGAVQCQHQQLEQLDDH